MVKIKSPLMSFKASGTIADFLTFSERKTGSQVRWQKKQKDVSSPLRVVQRKAFFLASLCARFWQCGDCFCGAVLCGADVDLINSQVQNQILSGYNLAIKKFIKYF